MVAGKTSDSQVSLMWGETLVVCRGWEILVVKPGDAGNISGRTILVPGSVQLYPVASVCSYVLGHGHTILSFRFCRTRPAIILPIQLRARIFERLPYNNIGN